MLKKGFSSILLIFLIYYPIACKNVFSAASEPVTENYFQTFLPRTGQTTCYNDSESAIPCTGTGQDGEFRRGAEWPNPRFKDNGNGTITDRLTGLMWEKSPSATPYTWQDAFNRIAAINSSSLGGYSDWRLPNIQELRSLLNYGAVNGADWLNNTQGFQNIQPECYWTSSTAISSTGYGYFANISDGQSAYNDKSTFYWAIAVRGKTIGAISLPRTGQTTCYIITCWAIPCSTVPCTSTGQDGDYQTGVPFPNPRFKDNGNGTITDRLTGLMWQKSPSATACTWQEAFDRIAAINSSSLGGYSDWRLPNVNELASLLDYGQSANAAWLMSQGFKEIKSNNYYWTGSRYLSALAYSMGVHLNDNRIVQTTISSNSCYTIAVRGGY